MATETVQIREFVVSYRGARRSVSARIRGAADAVRFFRSLIAGQAREHFVALFLDARRQPIAYSVVSVGTATASLVHPREVFQPAIACGAGSLLIAHNHPSGDATPSAEDRQVTERLGEVGRLIGIELLDHIPVIGQAGYISFSESGLL